MKKFIMLLSVLLAGCIHVDMDKVMTVEETNNKKLPTLEAVYVDATSKTPQYWEIGSKVVQYNSDRATLFYQQVEKNLTNPYGDLHGYIELRDKTLDKSGSDNFFWVFGSIWTFGTLNLLGMPFGHIKPCTEINVRVLDKTGKLVKRYQSKVEDSEYLALYWGYSSISELLLRNYRKALDDVMEQMQNDHDFLSKKLK